MHAMRKKQLMAFHLSEHVLLADEVGWEYETGHYTSRLHHKGMKLLQGLWEVQPDVPPRGGIIRASSVICASCNEFAVWAEDIYGVKFELQYY